MSLIVAKEICHSLIKLFWVNLSLFPTFYEGHLFLIEYEIHPLIGVLNLYFVCVKEMNGTFQCGWAVVCALGEVVLQIILELLVLLAIRPVQ